jgi:energy-coupling factor transporter ATP-binding protein EcfA2
MLGMDHDSTGIENIRLRGLYLDLSPAEIEARIDDITEFSKLGNYLHMPIRTYSSGMVVRLAFATLTSTRPDVVVMDEVIGAGDAAFIKSAQQRLENFMAEVGIVVVASHSLEVLKTMCNRGAVLHHGAMHFIGIDRRCDRELCGTVALAVTTQDRSFHHIQVPAYSPDSRGGSAFDETLHAMARNGLSGRYAAPVIALHRKPETARAVLAQGHAAVVIEHPGKIRAEALRVRILIIFDEPFGHHALQHGALLHVLDANGQPIEVDVGHETGFEHLVADVPPIHVAEVLDRIPVRSGDIEIGGGMDVVEAVVDVSERRQDVKGHTARPQRVVHRVKHVTDVEHVLGRSEVGRDIELLGEANVHVEVPQPVGAAVKHIHRPVLLDAEQLVERRDTGRPRRFSVEDLVQERLHDVRWIVAQPIALHCTA